MRLLKQMTGATGWALLVLAGCTGGSGADGAKGADGVAGADGTPGADGTDGDDGTDGTDGHDGRDGHVGDGPWGVNLEIVAIAGASGSGGAFQVGDFPEITFSVTDADGLEYDMTELAGLNFNLAGPTSHVQVAIYSSDLARPADNAVYNYDGTWTYAFDLPIPAVYDTVPNDTPDLGVDDGDWGGLALVDGTYLLGAWAYLNQEDEDGASYTETDNVTTNVLVGAATVLEPRQVVLAENCASCHGEAFDAHGGSRRDLDLCITCHVDGAEDRYSATDATTTPGATVGMTSMIHKIHMGADLTNGALLNGYPGDAAAAGYPNYNEHDFSDVVFPSWPLAASDCESCHEGATGGDVADKPTRLACGSCHDTVDFETGGNHEGGVQLDDSNCVVCHSSGFVPEHGDPRSQLDVWASNGHAADKSGVNVTVLSVTNGDGATTLQAGDTVTMTFSVLYDDGTPIPQSFFAYSASSSTCPTVSGSGTAVLVGPSDQMQRILSSPSASSTTVVGSVFGSSVVDPTTDIWTYTFQDTTGTAQAIPATYPLQVNATEADVGLFGDLYGEALRSGTYRVEVLMYTALWEDTTCASGSDTSERWRKAEPGFLDVLLGDATVVEPHAIVADAACESCHSEVRFHGGSRKGVDYCVTCHAPGATDGEVPAVSVDFVAIAHGAHASGADLGTPYAPGGAAYAITFPRLDGGVAACESCHGDNPAWQNPSTRGCMTCHTSDDDYAHAALNTDDVYGESCAVCHGEGSDHAVETVHAWLR
ncbi:MAG: hypothetical protein Q8P18_31995 [Pseudomonadota bacterium]|nr:hypothetical protein [Pseudomonadota bacterium]